MKGKRGQIWDHLTPWIIAITVLVIVLVFAFLLRERLGAMGEYIKNIFR